jgi:membrane-bound metal-dependent hydrolase YbcI (DUF457 family)
MFIGHYGVALAAKKTEPSLSLGTTIMATQFIDLLWPILLLTGLEDVVIDPGITAFNAFNFTHYPYTHSLLGCLIWGGVFGLVYFLITKDKKAAIISGLLVLSHWVLDFITHRPDLPLTFGENMKVGLGLWNYKLVTLIVESTIYTVGAALYLTVTRQKNKLGSILIAVFLISMAGMYLSMAFGPDPASEKSIATQALFGWLVVALGYWIDFNRTTEFRQEMVSRA